MAKEKMRQWVGWNDLTMFGDSGIDHLRQTLSDPSQQTQRQMLTELARANVTLELRELAQEAGRLQKTAERLAGAFRSPGSVPAQSEGDFLTVSGWMESVIESYAYCLFHVSGASRGLAFDWRSSPRPARPTSPGRQGRQEAAPSVRAGAAAGAAQGAGRLDRAVHDRPADVAGRARG